MPKEPGRSGQTYPDNTSCDDGDAQGGHVDGELKLEKLWHIIEDISAPHAGLDNADKVVVRDDDVRGFFGHFRSRNSLQNGRNIHPNRIHKTWREKNSVTNIKTISHKKSKHTTKNIGKKIPKLKKKN